MLTNEQEQLLLRLGGRVEDLEKKILTAESYNAVLQSIIDGDRDSLGDTRIDGPLLVDYTGTEAVLVRKNGDAGDVLIVDTTNDEIEIPTGNLLLANTTTSALGVIRKGGVRFIHNYQNLVGNGAVPIGLNTFIGVSAGNFTIGSTATAEVDGSYNVGVGHSTLFSLTIGAQNTCLGYSAGRSLTDGSQNMFIGYRVGYGATSASNNVGVGYATLSDTSLTGNGNSTLGSFSFGNLTTGYSNAAIGRNAGSNIAGGTGKNETSHTSVYIGAYTDAGADGNTNEIVIGYNAIGAGTNTVKLGNTSIVLVQTDGSVLIDRTDTEALLVRKDADGGDVFIVDTTNSRVGVGTDSPAKHLDVASNFTIAAPTIRLTDTSDGTNASYNDVFGAIEFYTKDTTGNAPIVIAYIKALSGHINPSSTRRTDLVFGTWNFDDVAPTERMRITHTGNVGIGITTPTAKLHLPAGTAVASTAPLKLTSGTLLTTPEAGVFEFLGDILYFTDTTTPTRRRIGYADTDYAGMYTYDEALSLAINTANTYHALHSVAADDVQTGLLEGWTFDEGRVVDANITSEAQTGSLLRIIGSAAHNLTTGDIVVITNANNAGHNTSTQVSFDATNPTTEFICDDITYVAGAGVSAAVVDEPAYLQVTEAVAEIYHLNWSMSGSVATANKEIKMEPVQNVTHLDNAAAERTFSNTSLGNMGGHGLISVNTGDRIWMQVKNNTDTVNVVVKHFNLVVSRR